MKPAFDKKAIVVEIIAQLRAERDRLMNAARAAHAEATDPQSKAENKYDTRGLEAAYLAGGQARKAAEIEDAIKQFQKLRLIEFSSATPIDLSALVEVKSRLGSDLFFLGPKRGGLEINFDGREVTVITPESPIGSQLIDRKLGDKFKLGTGASAMDYEIRLVT